MASSKRNNKKVASSKRIKKQPSVASQRKATLKGSFLALPAKRNTLAEGMKIMNTLHPNLSNDQKEEKARWYGSYARRVNGHSVAA